MKIYKTNEYSEKFIINQINIKDLGNINIYDYNFFPKNISDLKLIIRNKIEKFGYDADLNDIDVTKIKDMSFLFSTPLYLKNFDTGLITFSSFNGDISKWDVSNVTNMSYMFNSSEFNGDISKWNVSNVKNMQGMFSESKFNQDISDWDVSNVENMNNMFEYSSFDNDISKWNVSNVQQYKNMFNACPIKIKTRKHPKFKK